MQGTPRELALVGHGNDGVAGRRGDHDVDVLVVDELRRDLAGAVRVRLAVALDDLNRVLLAGDGDAAREHLAHLGQHPLIGLAEGGDGAGLRG